MATPASRFTAAPTPAGPALDRRAIEEDRSGDDWVSRTVSACGTISVSNQVFSVGKHRAGDTVDVRVTAELLEAWCGMELLKTVLRTSKGVAARNEQRHTPSDRPITGVSPISC